jgi:hypothetical protein
MSQTESSIGPGAGQGNPGDAEKRPGSAPELSTPIGHTQRRLRVPSLVAGSILCLLALSVLALGGWALWMDQVDRDGSGFITIGETTELQTETSAIISELRGDGPRWLYGSEILGDARVRATSQDESPLFIGITSTSDVYRYLGDAGYATIDHLETADLTTHPGGDLSGPPGRESIWEASTEGSGQQTLLWTPRDGDWSIVLMRADATSGVAIAGDVGAEFPALPWLAGGLLIAGAAVAALGGWLLIRGIRGEPESGRALGEASTGLQAGS